MHDHIEHPEAYESAIKRNIIANAQKTFCKRERAFEVLDWIERNQSRSDFAKSLAGAYATYGKLTDNQFAAVLRFVDKDCAKRAEWAAKRAAEAAKSEYVGEAGKRMAVVAKVVHVITLESEDYGTSWIHLLDDANGNRLVYKGTAYVGNVGDSVTMMAAVKEHRVYEGCKQTILARPTKIVVTEQENRA